MGLRDQQKELDTVNMGAESEDLEAFWGQSSDCHACTVGHTYSHTMNTYNK